MKMNHVWLPCSYHNHFHFTLGACFNIFAADLKKFYCFMTKEIWTKTFFKRNFLVLQRLHVFANISYFCCPFNNLLKSLVYDVFSVIFNTVSSSISVAVSISCILNKIKWRQTTQAIFSGDLKRCLSLPQNICLTCVYLLKKVFQLDFFATYFAWNGYSLISEWFPTIGQHIKVQEAVIYNKMKGFNKNDSMHSLKKYGYDIMSINYSGILLKSFFRDISQNLFWKHNLSIANNKEPFLKRGMDFRIN